MFPETASGAKSGADTNGFTMAPGSIFSSKDEPETRGEVDREVSLLSDDVLEAPRADQREAREADDLQLFFSS